MKHLLMTLLVICSFFMHHDIIYSQNTDIHTDSLAAWIDSSFIKGLEDYNIAGATIILMQGDSVLHIKGYGLANIESNTPVNSTSSIFGIGSISKTFAATAIMQLYEDGKLELDRDVNNYLTSFQLEYEFKDSITVRRLLTHTAGIDMRSIGSVVRAEKDVIPLAQYIKRRMPTQIRPSGRVIAYTDDAYALLGLIVEEVSGMPCYEYIGQNILKPLEMDYSGFKRQADFKEDYATGYLQKGGQLIPCKPGFKLDYPAGGLNATASDMGHYISMFLNNGNFKGIQILDSTTVAIMRQEPFRHYEKAGYGWLLGFQEWYWHGMQLYGHTGSILGFESQLSLIPEKNIGLFISTNTTNYLNSKSRVFINNYINSLLTRLMPDSITKKEKAVMPAAGSVDEPLEKFTGTYRSIFYGYKTLNKLAVLVGLAPEFKIVSNDSTLEIVEFDNKLVPISDLTFHSVYNYYVAFGRDTKGDISYFFINANSFNKLKWYEPVKFQMFWVGSIILILLSYIIVSVVRKLFVRNKKSHLIKTINFSLASLIALFMVMLVYALITTDPAEFFYGIPLLLKVALIIPFIIIPLAFVSIYFLIKTIRYKELGTLDLIYQSVIVVAALVFIPWLMYYNLIGFNY